MRRKTLGLFLAFLVTVAAHAAPQKRVATLLPYAGEALARAGVPIVASATAGSEVPLPAGAAQLGNAHSPSFEVLAASRPNVVVADRQLHAALRQKLAIGKAVVILIDGSSVNGTFEGLVAAADAAGAGAQMRKLVAEQRAQLASLGSKTRGTVLPLFGTPNQFMAVTSQTWLGDLLQQVGYRNVLADAEGQQPVAGYADVSDEMLSSLRPERVMLVCHGDPVAIEASLRKRGGRGALRGDSNLVVLPPTLFARNPGLRMAEAARLLIELPAQASR